MCIICTTSKNKCHEGSSSKIQKYLVRKKNFSSLLYTKLMNSEHTPTNSKGYFAVKYLL